MAIAVIVANILLLLQEKCAFTAKTHENIHISFV